MPQRVARDGRFSGATCCVAPRLTAALHLGKREARGADTRELDLEMLVWTVELRA
jgi:hypothetical protein